MQFTPDDSRVQFETQGDDGFSLDVRELLLDGGEPFAYIMECVHQLQPGQTLQLHAIFEPVPLIKKLGKQGFTLTSAHAGLDHWVLSILRPE